MAAPLQTFLFKYGAAMADKSVGLAVSSGESSIEGVEADMKRLIPNAKYLEPSLWILRSHTDKCPDIDYRMVEGNPLSRFTGTNKL